MAKNKSILQDTKECYLCRMEAEKMGYFGRLPDTGLDKHHFIHGNANRQLAEKYMKRITARRQARDFTVRNIPLTASYGIRLEWETGTL